MSETEQFEPWIERSGPGQPSTLAATEAVRCIRAICAQELGMPFDYPFFQADYRAGEDADMALVRLFMAERRHHGSDFYTVLVLCHG